MKTKDKPFNKITSCWKNQLDILYNFEKTTVRGVDCINDKYILLLSDWNSYKVQYKEIIFNKMGQLKTFLSKNNLYSQYIELIKDKNSDKILRKQVKQKGKIDILEKKELAKIEKKNKEEAKKLAERLIYEKYINTNYNNILLWDNNIDYNN